MNRIKAVIFDMDGVMVDTEPVYYNKRKECHKEIGIDIPENVLVKTVGGNRAEIWKVIKEYVEKTMDQDTYYEVMGKYYQDVKIDYPSIEMPNLRNLLEYCKEKELKLGVASSTGLELITKILTELDLIKYFETVISGQQFKRSKPDPEIYLVSAQKLGVNPSECLVVEDSNMGITAGKAANMTVVARKHHIFDIDQSNADYIVEDLIDVKKIIEKYNK